MGEPMAGAQFVTGIAPEHPGMVPLIADGQLVAMLTWTEAIYLGAAMTVFGAGAAPMADAPPHLSEATMVDALNAAEKAHAHAIQMWQQWQEAKP